ncbi:MAG: carboxynorspermidine decarboxylase, partial [Verrucomicrobia bacterium]
MDHLLFYDPALPPEVPSPCYVVDLERLENNLRVLREVQEASGAKILGALKGFAMPQAFPLMSRYLSGITASGPHEAMLGREFLEGGEIHVYAVVFSEADIQAVLPIADHLVFNSVGQWQRFRSAVTGARRRVSPGLRVNPEYSEVEVAIYNPCTEGSRLGVRREALAGVDLTGLEGLHFHTMCEQGADTLGRTLERFEEKFGDLLPRMKWVNFGGGHHITSPVYDRSLLVELIRGFRVRWPHLTVYLEPGEALAINTGVLVATVLDVVETPAGPVANLDVSATCHMPDVLEMPYRP